MAERKGTAEWRGDLRSGSGELTVGEGVFQGAYSFASRFEEGEGTNPEELLAAAHAACYSMALSNILATEGHAPQSVRTHARVSLRNVEGLPTIARIELETEASVPGLEDAAFQEYARQAKEGCVVSRALAGVSEMELQAQLQ